MLGRFIEGMELLKSFLVGRDHSLACISRRLAARRGKAEIDVRRFGSQRLRGAHLLGPVGEGVVAEVLSVSLHGALDRDAPEILAEYAHVSHDPATGTGDFPGSDAYYIQVGYRFGYQLRDSSLSLKPYVRVEQVVVPLGDDVFTPLALNYDGVVVGVRYDPGVFLALRLEYRYEQFEGLDTTNSFYAQASFVLAGS